MDVQIGGGFKGHGLGQGHYGPWDITERIFHTSEAFRSCIIVAFSPSYYYSQSTTLWFTMLSLSCCRKTIQKRLKCTKNFEFWTGEISPRVQKLYHYIKLVYCHESKAQAADKTRAIVVDRQDYGAIQLLQTSHSLQFGYVEHSRRLDHAAEIKGFAELFLGEDFLLCAVIPTQKG